MIVHYNVTDQTSRCAVRRRVALRPMLCLHCSTDRTYSSESTVVACCARAPCEPPSYAPRDHVTPWKARLLDTDTTAGFGGSRVMLREFTGDALQGRCCCYLYTLHRLLIIWTDELRTFYINKWPEALPRSYFYLYFNSYYIYARLYIYMIYAI